MRITPLEEWIVGKSGIKERRRALLEEYQLVKIKEILNYAKRNSKFYRETLRDVNTEELHTFDDFKNIPCTQPSQIAHNPVDFLCLPQREIKRIVTIKSSGTSGEEKRIYFSQQDLNLTIDFFKVGMSCLTDQRDRVMILLPGNSFGSIGALLKSALEMSKVQCFIHGVMTDPEQTAKEIVEKDINCLVGIPMQVLQLSRLNRELFYNRIKKVLLSTDYVPEVLMDELTQGGCKVFSHYGMTEMGYGGGVECEALAGYHMREADLYFEIIDPDTAEPVKDGELGEVVFTTLTREAMPLIRYRTGDMASLSQNPCACGTFLKTMNKVMGRRDNKIPLDGEKFLHLRELDEVLLSFDEILDYKAYRTEEKLLKIKILLKSPTIQKNTAQRIQTVLQLQFKGDLRFCVSESMDNGFEKVRNSMVKRRISGWRGME